MDIKEGRRKAHSGCWEQNTFDVCWEFDGQSCWQLNKFTRWLERKLYS